MPYCGVEGSAARRETYEVGNVAMEGVTESWSTVTGKKGKGKKSKAGSASKPSCGTSGVASSATPLVVAVPPDPLKLPVGGQSQAQPGLRQQGLGGAKYGQVERSTARVLVEPTTAAVVLTLRKEAAERGHTYAALLSRAKQDISLSGLGIERVSVRTTATGARMLEIPGSQRGKRPTALRSAFGRCWRTWLGWRDLSNVRIFTSETLMIA
ncbi:unnamed protein product [Pieris macdunnoughi]|uniref:Uncharacterized protein n=1 Tax=Pieris macdunnoughi TaxID=345717 RepID=A0A821WR06_9NEOP|nr:unnamed protein product [Pieris macdunnoughi]